MHLLDLSPDLETQKSVIMRLFIVHMCINDSLANILNPISHVQGQSTRQ